jgi:hypothetical protein
VNFSKHSRGCKFKASAIYFPKAFKNKSDSLHILPNTFQIKFNEINRS